MKISKSTLTTILVCLTLNAFASEVKTELIFQDALEKGDYYCCIGFQCTIIPPEPAPRDNGGVAGNFKTELDKWRMKGDISHHHANERSTVFVQLFEENFVQTFHIFMDYGTKIATLIRSPHGNGSIHLDCRVNS